MNKELRILREKKIPFLSTFTALLAAVIANTPNKIYTKFILHKNQTNEYYFDSFTLFYIYHGCASSKDSIKTVSKLLLNSFHLVFYWRWRKLLNHIHLRVQNFGNEKKKKSKFHRIQKWPRSSINFMTTINGEFSSSLCGRIERFNGES